MPTGSTPWCWRTIRAPSRRSTGAATIAYDDCRAVDPAEHHHPLQGRAERAGRQGRGRRFQFRDALDRPGRRGRQHRGGRRQRAARLRISRHLPQERRRRRPHQAAHRRIRGAQQAAGGRQLLPADVRRLQIHPREALPRRPERRLGAAPGGPQRPLGRLRQQLRSDPGGPGLPAAARGAPKPRIAGLQTAIVVGKSGEEIWTDKYGRIKVQFHWDQLGANDEKSSCWIRVAHGWAGKGWGQIFIPRIGQEVVISFLEGDPDRPLVTGSVYNAEQTVPYTLPDDQTKSTIKSNVSKGGGGYNELRFEDLKDSEEVYLQAQKDMNQGGQKQRHPEGRLREEGQGQPDDRRLPGPHGDDRPGQRKAAGQNRQPHRAGRHRHRAARRQRHPHARPSPAPRPTTTKTISPRRSTRISA